MPLPSLRYLIGAPPSWMTEDGWNKKGRVSSETQHLQRGKEDGRTDEQRRNPLVPNAVGVKNAGMPAPPARMRSASVPCSQSPNHRHSVA